MKIQGVLGSTSRWLIACIAVILSGVTVTWASGGGLPTVWTSYQLPGTTCSGYPDTDPTFRFWAKRGTVNNLVVFFEGGGACWDSFTCANPIGNNTPNQFYMPAIPLNTDPSQFKGIFDVRATKNPVKDWSFVYIPYCTGDVHLGLKDATYTDSSGTSLTIHHQGFKNFLAVLLWTRTKFFAPQKVLVAGSSAGAYGATGNFAWIKEAFPRAQAFLIADAGQGVTPSSWDQQIRNSSWNLQLPPWIFGISSTGPAVSTKEIINTVMDYYPRSKFSQYTTAWDSVQIGFYSVMLLSLGTPPSSPYDAAMNWHNQMVDDLGARQSYSNFRSYLATGPDHTIMRSDKFYSENSAGINYAKWVTDMLNNGQDWVNASCETVAGCL